MFARSLRVNKCHIRLYRLKHRTGFPALEFGCGWIEPVVEDRVSSRKAYGFEFLPPPFAEQGFVVRAIVREGEGASKCPDSAEYEGSLQLVGVISSVKR